jgi:glycosyltransferase involved in cell wall biosynthesis
MASNNVTTESLNAILNKALKLLQSNDPRAALATLKPVDESAVSHIYYKYIKMISYNQLGLDTEAKSLVLSIGQQQQIPADIATVTLQLASNYQIIAPDLIKLAQQHITGTLQTHALIYLRQIGLFDEIIDASSQIDSTEHYLLLAESLIYTGNSSKALDLLRSAKPAIKRDYNVSCLLRSVEKLNDRNKNNCAPTQGKLAIITPLGPGHQAIFQQCKDSIAKLKLPAGWTCEHIVVDDSKAELGRSAARNQGVKSATKAGANWIFFLDADDLIDENALHHAAPALADNDAVWGLISAFKSGENSTIRSPQIPYIDDLPGVLSTPPFQTLQMGHFVRTEIAIQHSFNEARNCGEDFQYYLEIWKHHRCIKLPIQLFHNRRGEHSTGRLSATGAEWAQTTNALIKENLSQLASAVLVNGIEIKWNQLIKSKLVYFSTKDFTNSTKNSIYRSFLSPGLPAAAFDFFSSKDEWQPPGAANIDRPCLIDIRNTPQRFLSLSDIADLSHIKRVDILTSTENDALIFSVNLPRHRISSNKFDDNLGHWISTFKISKRNPPLHIAMTGYSRSGTTMAYNMFATTAKDMEFFKEETPLYSVIHDDNRRTLTKRPLDIFDLARLERSTGAKKTALIICYRDIRSLITSRHKMVKEDYFMGYDKTYRILPGDTPTYSNPGILDTHNAILNALKSKAFSMILPLKYEDLINSPEYCKEIYGGFLGIDFKGNFSDFHKSNIAEGLQSPLNGLRAIDSSTISKWKNAEHQTRLTSQFLRAPELNDLNAFYGYEAS